MEIKTLQVAGFEAAIKGMRNPMDSWNRLDSYTDEAGNFIFGANDLKLAQTLVKAGTEHGKFMRQIHVWVDMDMPRYWWSEMDTYSHNTKNSCSTIHKLMNKQKPIRLEQFTYEPEDEAFLMTVIDKLNEIREQWLVAETTTEKNALMRRAKQLLPEGFLQLRTVSTNYAELRNIYFQRRQHKLKKEWQDTFVEWLKTLPYAEELIMIEAPKRKEDN